MYLKSRVFPRKELLHTELPHSQLLSCLPAATVPPASPLLSLRHLFLPSGKYLASSSIILLSSSFITSSALSPAAINSIPGFSEAGGGRGGNALLSAFTGPGGRSLGKVGCSRIVTMMGILAFGSFSGFPLEGARDPLVPS